MTAYIHIGLEVWLVFIKWQSKFAFLDVFGASALEAHDSDSPIFRIHVSFLPFFYSKLFFGSKTEKY